MRSLFLDEGARPFVRQDNEAMSSKNQQIDSLTPLRGIAALLVVCYHIDSLAMMLKLGTLLPKTGFLARGYLWVDFFFVLSGFIITHVYGSRFVAGVSRQAFREFFISRFSRLYPLHFFTLTLTVLLYIGVYSKMPAPKTDDGGGFTMAMLYDWKALPYHYLLLVGFGLTGMTWNVPAWSIATEWQTYLLTLPLFRFLHRGVSARTFLVPLACTGGLFALVSNSASHTLNITFDFGLIRCLLEFAIGICLYAFYQERERYVRLSKDSALLFAAALTVLTLHFPIPPVLPPNVPIYMVKVPALTPLMDALSPLVFAFLILCAAMNEGKGKRLLNGKPLVKLGEISYSVYLMQGVAFMFFFIPTGAWRQKHPVGEMGAASLWGYVAVTLIADIVMALMTYRWIEVPARRWIRKKALRGSE